MASVWCKTMMFKILGGFLVRKCEDGAGWGLLPTIYLINVIEGDDSNKLGRCKLN